jgi:hypothetical protein
MNRAAPFARNLDRAAAIVLAGGLVLFVLLYGVNAPWRFFAPIFEAFTGSGESPDSLGPKVIADFCFLFAVLLFAIARAAGFWGHYSAMPILNWATGDARRRRAARRPGGPEEPAPQEFESEEEYYDRVHPQPVESEAAPRPDEAASETAPTGPGWRSSLISFWELLSERRTRPAAQRPPGPPTRLLSPTNEVSGRVPPTSKPAAGPAAGTATQATAPAERPPISLVDVYSSAPDEFSPVFHVPEQDDVAETPSADLGEDHDFASDPDFRANTPGAVEDDDDFWPPEEIT